MSNQELCHWGIKGMRWGHRRFQNKDGSLTPAGKERYDDDDSSSGKERAIKSGKASEVAKYKNQMSNQELQNAITRINLERQLSGFQDQEVQSGFDKVNSVMDKFGKVTNWAETGLRAYNLIAKVNNSVNSNKKLPALDGGESAAKAAKEAAEEAAKVTAAERKKYIDNLTARQAYKERHNLTAEETESIKKRLVNEGVIKDKYELEKEKRKAKNEES